MQTRFARVLAGTLVAGLVLLCAEGVARLALGPPAAPLVARLPDGGTDLFERTDRTLRPLYQGPFQSVPIDLVAPAGARRVVWLGGSSIRSGSPEHEEAATLATQTLGAVPLNLAGPGLDTGHIAVLLPDVLALRPAAVVLYTGHNDLGNSVFYNRYADSRTIHVARARATLGKSRLFSQLEVLLRGREVFAVPRPGSGGRYQMTAERRAVVQQRYEERLRRIIHEVVDAGIPMVVATVVSNPLAPSIAWTCDEDLAAVGYRSLEGEAFPLDGLDAAALRQRVPDDADLGNEGLCVDLRWAAARQAGADGQHQRAIEALDHLRDRDPLPVRADRTAVDAIRQIALDEGALLADVNVAFRAAGGGLEPPDWFRDQVHFNKVGNQALAAAVAPTLARALGQAPPAMALPAVGPLPFGGCGSARCR